MDKYTAAAIGGKASTSKSIYNVDRRQVDKARFHLDNSRVASVMYSVLIDIARDIPDALKKLALRQVCWMKS